MGGSSRGWFSGDRRALPGKVLQLTGSGGRTEAAVGREWSGAGRRWPSIHAVVRLELDPVHPRLSTRTSFISMGESWDGVLPQRAWERGESGFCR